MSFTEIQQQVSQMSPEERDKLSAFLVALRIRENDLFSEVSKRLDDPSDQWIDWEQAKNDLGFTDDELRP
jgi:hypothetical protein